jgi:hypothetical protein
MLSNKDLAGVMVTGLNEKEELKGYLKKAGVADVNGIPLDKFIVVYAGHNKKGLADMTIGLHEGVLP